MSVLQPRQFGNYTIQHDPLRYRTVTASTPSGKNVGYLMWNKPDPDRPAAQAGLIDGSRPTISSVKVNKPQQGRGLAGAMLQHALEHEPRLQHDAALTDDGKRFASKYPLS